MTFGEKLRELREAAGLSERELANRSGVPFGTLHNYGIGIRKPTLAAAVKLATALGVTCEAFSGCDDVAGGQKSGKRKRASK
jgi:transcriptional regulator with XRE-family HTH domain